MLDAVIWNIVCMLVGIANSGPLDWDNLQIIETNDEEGRL
jgi:hypothetical protein